MNTLLRVGLWLGLGAGSYAADGTGVAVREGATVSPMWVEVVWPASIPEVTSRGRVFLFVAPTGPTEPRLQGGASLFGVDVVEAKAGQRLVLEGDVLGYPEQMLSELPPGDYMVQALFNRYTEFHRADGHVIWAHNDQWEGQNFAKSPGNLISAPQPLRVVAGARTTARLTLDQVIPPIVVPADTGWVKRLKLPSERLSKFWGRPMYLGATVLLPKGYAEHPEVRYPVVYIQGHFGLGAPFGFNPTPDADRKKSWSRLREEAATKNLPVPPLPAGAKTAGEVSNAETGHEFFEAWTAPDFPRVIAVTLQHPTPYFDDSYGVNSPNCGPYGDAIRLELLTEIERQFRTIPDSYARVLTGGSTGGWGSLAMLLYNPEFYGGAWAFSPDPVDFRLYYGGVNAYEDDNAFGEKPGADFAGGGRSNRRGSQKARVIPLQDPRFEWWKHTPVGPDGYPRNVWDLETGKIDRGVVQAMRAQGFDLREYLARNWSKIGPQLVGKLHVYAAHQDSFYSHLPVRLLEEFMRSTKNPAGGGTFTYGPVGSKHGWNPTTNAVLVRAMAKEIAAQAPSAESSAVWHYP